MPYKSYEMKKLKEKLRYTERLSKGVCVVCGDKIDSKRKGLVYCSFCAKKREIARKTFKNACDYWDCFSCPHPFCVADEKKAIERENKRLKATRKSYVELAQKRKKLGVCIRCGGLIEDGLMLNCRKCQDKQNANSRRYHAEHYVSKVYDEELCHVCHKKPKLPDHNTCQECYERCRKSAYHMNEVKIPYQNGLFRKTNHLFFLSSLLSKRRVNNEFQNR